MSSFKGNENGSKQVFYMKFTFEQSHGIVFLYTQICKIHRYETFVNMFVFSLNRLTPSRGEGAGLVTQICMLHFLYKVKQR